MIGTFGRPQEEGSMSIFTTREAAAEFVPEDPFVLDRGPLPWSIRDWNEALAPYAPGLATMRNTITTTMTARTIPTA